MSVPMVREVHGLSLKVTRDSGLVCGIAAVASWRDSGRWGTAMGRGETAHTFQMSLL